MKNRISQRLLNHQHELRKRALKAETEKLRKDYWWLYHDAMDIEPEFREMMLKAENRHLLEMIIESGLIHVLLEDEKNNLPPEDEPNENKSDEEPPDHEDDIPPRQMGFWE